MSQCIKCKKKFDGPLWKQGKCRVCYETDKHANLLEDVMNDLLGGL